MKRTMRWASVAALLSILVLRPVPALAGDVTTRVVAQTTGPEIAAAFLRNTEGLELGSSSATVTVSVDGVPHDIRVGFGDVGKGLTGESGPTKGLLELLAIPTLAATFLRVLRSLARLGST